MGEAKLLYVPKALEHLRANDINLDAAKPYAPMDRNRDPLFRVRSDLRLVATGVRSYAGTLLRCRRTAPAKSSPSPKPRELHLVEFDD